MPIYCFTSSGGVTVEEVFRMGETPESIFLEAGHGDDDCGVYQEEYFRDRAAEWKSGPRSGERGKWPIECYASGVHASQAQDLRDHFKKHSVDCDVTPNGDPVYRNHQHRKKALACRGIHDRASFGT